MYFSIEIQYYNKKQKCSCFSLGYFTKIMSTICSKAPNDQHDHVNIINIQHLNICNIMIYCHKTGSSQDVRCHSCLDSGCYLLYCPAQFWYHHILEA